MKYELRHEVWNDVMAICLAAFRYEDEAHEYADKLRKRGTHGIKVKRAPS